MAYITQQEIDAKENARRQSAQNSFINAIGEGFDGLEANRLRALERKRQNASEFAKAGISFTDEEIEDPYKKFPVNGDSSLAPQSLFDKYSNSAAEARKRKADNEDINKKYKEFLMTGKGPNSSDAKLDLFKKKEEIKANLEKDKVTNSKKQMSANDILKVNEGTMIPSMLKDVESTIAQNPDLFNPVTGTFKGMNPFDEKSKTAQAQLKASAQAFGKYMEGGVLRKEDEVKYEKMMPQLGDSPEVARNKLQIVQRLLANKNKGDIEALRKSGYDVSGISSEGGAPAIPQVLNPQQPVAPEIINTVKKMSREEKLRILNAK